MYSGDRCISYARNAILLLSTEFVTAEDKTLARKGHEMRDNPLRLINMNVQNEMG